MPKLSQFLKSFSDSGDAQLLLGALRTLFDRAGSQIFSSAGIAQATTTTKVKTATAINYIAGGNAAYKGITDNFWDLTGLGTISDGKVNVICLFIDAAGTASAALGRETTTGTAGQLAPGLVFPPIPEGKAMVGFVIVSCSGGAFTCGTSNVATAGNFTVTFVNNPLGLFDPTSVV